MEESEEVDLLDPQISPLPDYFEKVYFRIYKLLVEH